MPKKPAAKKPTAKERAVVVTTTSYGAHFGYTVEDERSETIKLRSARNSYYWKVATGTGIAQLAVSGPLEGSRIGARADVTLRNVGRVYDCTPEAVAAWESVQWAK